MLESKEEKQREIKINKQPISSENTNLNETIAQTPSNKHSFVETFIRSPFSIQAVLANFLDWHDLLNFAMTNQGYYKIHGNRVAIKALKEEIGADPKQLIKENEQPAVAFLRHKQEIKQLREIPMHSVEELAMRLMGNPQRYFVAIAGWQGFLFLEDSRGGLRTFLKCLEDYPACTPQIFHYILSNFSDPLVTMIFSKKQNFFRVIKKYPQYKEMFIKNAVKKTATLFGDGVYLTFLEIMITNHKFGAYFPGAYKILMDVLFEFPESAGFFIEAVVSNDNLFRIVFPKQEIVNAFNKYVPQYKRIIQEGYRNLPRGKIKFDTEARSSSLRRILKSKNMLSNVQMPLIRTDYFKKVFYSEQRSLNTNLLEFLDANSTLVLSRTCRGFWYFYHDSYAKKLLLENIGPNETALMKQFKSYSQACSQHRIIQKHWKKPSPVSHLEDFAKLLKKIYTPGYYLRFFISPKEFEQLFFGLQIDSKVLLNFLKQHPEYVVQIYEYIYKDLSFFDFATFFNVETIVELCANFPIFTGCLFKSVSVGIDYGYEFLHNLFSQVYINRKGLHQSGLDSFLYILNELPAQFRFICERIISSERLFRSIFSSITNVRKFCKIYPEYKETVSILFQFLSNDKIPKILSTGHAHLAQLLLTKKITADDLDLIPYHGNEHQKSLLMQNEILASYLNASDILKLSLTNSSNYKTLYDLRYVRLIQDKVGSNAKLLIGDNKTAFVAYHRHRRFLNGLKLVEITNFQELAERLGKYPDYHVKELVFSLDLNALFIGNTEENKHFAKFHEFVNKYPQHLPRMIAYLCSDFWVYATMIPDYEHLMSFAAALPEYEQQIIDRFTTNPISKPDKIVKESKSQPLSSAARILFLGNNHNLVTKIDVVKAMPLSDKEFNALTPNIFYELD
jgi:hypothetical protein